MNKAWMTAQSLPHELVVRVEHTSTASKPQYTRHHRFLMSIAIIRECIMHQNHINHTMLPKIEGPVMLIATRSRSNIHLDTRYATNPLSPGDSIYKNFLGEFARRFLYTT